jgi:hypothetical protein
LIVRFFLQVVVLKDSIRDLEASLNREREFNADGHRINADYLVNILRKFLTTNDLSERAKLVQVVCSILHLKDEETKIISDKWSVKPTGLVGWLTSRRGPAQSGQSSVSAMAGAGAAMGAGAVALASASTEEADEDEEEEEGELEEANGENDEEENSDEESL